MKTLAALLVLLGVACVWASAGETEVVTDNFVTAPSAVRVVQNLAVLSADPSTLVKARTVPHLPHLRGTFAIDEAPVQGNAFDAAPTAADQVAEEDEMELVEAEDIDADSETDADADAGDESRFAEAEAAPSAATAKGTGSVPSDSTDPAGPPRPKGVSKDATVPTPPQPKPVAAPAKGKDKKIISKPVDEPQRIAVGTLDGPVQRHGDKPDAVLDFVKDILAVPEKEGLPDATLKTTKAVGKATCGKGCALKLPIMVGWAGLNERPAHKTGRRVIVPGDRERTRARHEALKVPRKYTWKQPHLDKARRHLKRASKRITNLRKMRKVIGDTPLAVPVVI